LLWFHLSYDNGFSREFRLGKLRKDLPADFGPYQTDAFPSRWKKGRPVLSTNSLRLAFQPQLGPDPLASASESRTPLYLIKEMTEKDDQAVENQLFFSIGMNSNFFFFNGGRSWNSFSTQLEYLNLWLLYPRLRSGLEDCREKIGNPLFSIPTCIHSIPRSRALYRIAWFFFLFRRRPFRLKISKTILCSLLTFIRIWSASPHKRDERWNAYEEWLKLMKEEKAIQPWASPEDFLFSFSEELLCSWSRTRRRAAFLKKERERGLRLLF